MPCEVRVMDSSTLNDGSSQNSNETEPTVINEESLLVQQFTKNGMQSLMELIKASNNLPNEKWDFYTTFPSFKKMVGSESQKILDLLSSVLQHQQIKGNIFRRDNEEKYEMVIEANDGILERVDCNLDELQGLKKNPEPVVGKIKAIDRRGRYASYKQNDINAPANIMEQNKFRTLITTRLNVRPQIKFKDKIDNRNIPFEPRIKEKPNALKPLSILVEKIDDRGESFSHPYEYELDLFKPPEDQLKICDPQTPKTVDETPLIYVNNLDTLNTMIEHLKNHREIAVDLEHHSYRSFQGFTCLLQISTREQDFIVDALDLRHELYRLNEFFTNPKVVKVFHGSELDVEWLQRDLCLYLVNLFDTHQAARVLDFPRLSLAHLLKVFCNVDCNKQFQLYDWRTRPLSEAAIKYAREDTHYLLYIYDKMKNLLIEKCQNKSNLLENVINMSTDLCRRKYWKPILTDSSYMEFYRRSRKMFDNKQMYALKHLYEWRDKKARDEDESVMYVLPNHMLLNIAESLPREVQGVSALCNPVPPLVKQYEREIHQIIFKAREQSLVKPVLEGEALNQSLKEVQPNWVPVNVDSKLYCPHDLSHNDDFRENLPTLLEKKIDLLSIGTMKNNKFATNSSVIDVIHNNDQRDRSEWSGDLLRGKERQWKFVSPYQRYQKVMAFVNSEENKPLESKEKVDDGPSPAKIARLDVPSESNAQETTEKQENDIKEPKQNDEAVKNDQCETKNNITEEVSSPAITESAKKKKKKKKKIDSDMNTCEEVEESPVQSSNENETIVVNDPFIPNLRFNEDDVSSTNVVPDVNKQQSDTSTKPIKSNERKKKLNVDPKDKDESDNTDKKRAKSKNDFQPYNYSDADFSRFQSSTPQPYGPKKLPNTTKGRRTPWLGNKKNSIKKTIGSIGK